MTLAVDPLGCVRMPRQVAAPLRVKS